MFNHLARSTTGRVAAVGALIGIAAVWLTPWKHEGALLLLGSGLLGGYAGWLGELRTWLKASARAFQRAHGRWRTAIPEGPWLKAAPAPVELGWSITVAGMLLVLAWMAGTQDPLGWDLFTATVTLGLAVATVDFACLAKRVSEWLWSSAAGKIVMGLLSSLVAPSALSWGRTIVLAITHEDPSKAPASVVIFTWACAVLAWINAIACISAIVSLPVMAKTLVRSMHNTDRRERPRSIVWKLRKGIRPVFLCLAPFWVLMGLTTGELPSNRWLRAAATIVVVRLDYLEEHACGQPVERANRIDDHRVSVVMRGATWPTVETISCPRP